MEVFDINSLLIVISTIAGTFALVTGVFLIVGSYFNFRAEINQSMNMDLEVIRVSKKDKPENQDNRKQGEVWKEEIGAMEQMFTAISSVKDTRSVWQNFIWGTPSISFEIANSSNSEEIVFFISIPKKFRESIEKQIHSFFPNAVLERSDDYTIFSPGSFTEASVLTLKKKYIYPIKTYENLDVDPLNAITNALSKLKTKEEGAAIQLVMRPAGTHWRAKGKRDSSKDATREKVERRRQIVAFHSRKRSWRYNICNDRPA